MSLAASASGRSILIFTSKPAGPQDGGVDHVLTVGGTDHDHVLQALHAVDLGEQLRDDGVLHVRADTGATGAEEGLHLVEEDDDGSALAGLLTSTLEDQADLPLGLADVLVQELGTLDVEEEALARGLSGHLGDLLGQRVGDGLGDERLAASRRPVEQDALGRPQFVLLKQIGIEVRELDRVADGLDLAAETTDLLVADVRDLFEDEFLDLTLGNDLVDISGARFEQQGVAGADDHVQQRLGEPYHPFLVGVPHHEGALAVLEDLLEGDDVADALVLHGLDHVESLVEHHFLAAPELLEFHARADVHPQLAAAGEDVRRAVLIRYEEDTEAVAAVRAGRPPP